MADKIMNIKIKLETGRKLHALAEKHGETMLEALDRIIEVEWQNDILQMNLEAGDPEAYAVMYCETCIYYDKFDNIHNNERNRNS